MDTALELLAAPAAAARVGSRGRFGGAGFAADGGVALVVECEARDVVLAGVGFDAVPCPVGEDRDLLQRLAGGQAMVFDLLEAGAGRRLLAAQAGEPPGEGFERAHERLDLANLAALGGVDDVEKAEVGFVFGEGCERKRVDEVEIPVTGEAVTIFEERGEVITGLEKEDGDLWKMPAQHVQDDHIFGLEAGGETDVFAVRGAEDLGDEEFGGEGVGCGRE